MAAEHLKPLTSLRFFAALWVVVFAYWPNLAASGTPAFVGKGFLGVELFFVLSGFILCHVYLPAWEEARFGYGKFIWARIARVYPLHLATLAGIGLLGAGAVLLGLQVGSGILAWDVLPANILMVHAWGFASQAGWNHPSWSISAEWFAYLSFPLFAWATVRMRDRPLLAVAGALAGLFVTYIVFQRLAGFPLTQATFAWGALRIVPCFALGCALYLLWRSRAVQGRTTAVLGSALSVVTLVLSAAAGAPDGVIVAAGAMLILFLAASAQNGSKLGTHRVWVYLGEISYALYMVAIPWQLVFVNVAARILHLPEKQLPLSVWLIYLASAVIVAAVAHHLVERPAREGVRLWGEHLFRDRRSAAGA
jgi:peptidoglycan/LPS O-acetylase OafA/YrhL